MKRDMDLIRQMLLVVESVPLGHAVTADSYLEFAGGDRLTVCEHALLLARHHLVEGQFTIPYRTDPVKDFCISRLTWDGHEYLETVRSESVWAETKSTFAKKGLDLTFELVKVVATGIIKHRLGLPPG